MSRELRQSTPGLLARHLSARRAPSVLLAVFVGIAVLVIALIPRAVATLAQSELEHHLTSLSPLRIDLTATGRLGWHEVSSSRTGGQQFAAMEEDLAALPSKLGEPLAGILDEPEWVAQLPREAAIPREPRTNVPLELSLALELDWEDRVRFIEGVPPQAWSGEPAEADDPPAEVPIEIAISQNAADQMGLRAGDLIDVAIAPLLVSGVYEPIDPEDRYWAHAYELRRGSEIRGPGGQPILTASVYLNPLTSVPLRSELQGAGIRVWYPAVIDAIEYADAAALLVATQKLTALGETLSNGEPLTFDSNLSNEIGGVVDRVTAITALLALIGSAALGVVFAVLALGVRAVLERRRPVLGLASARGATPTQLRLTMLIEGLIIAGPVSVAALVIAALLAPARVGLETLVVPILVALVPPGLFAAMASPRLLAPVRADLGARTRGRSRWIIEATIAGLAALALVLLYRRGLVTASASLGLDPLLAATPLLLALTTGVAVLRLYPVPLLAFQRRLARRPGAVGMLGSARAVREPAGSFAGVLSIVVAVAAAVFALVMAATVTAGLESAARQAVGADIRLEQTGVSREVIDEIAGTPGVRGVVAYEIVPEVAITMGFDRVSVDAVFADLAALAELRPDLLPSVTAAEPGIPFLASPDIAERMSDTTTTIADADAVRVGIVPEGALPGTGKTWLLIDAAHAPELIGAEYAPSVVLVDTTSDVTELSAAIAGMLQASEREAAEITDTASVLAEAASRPLTAGLSTALGVAAALSLLLGVLAIVLGTVAATGARNRMVGVLRMLGMTPRQVRGLVAWELGPVAITSVLAGTALGLALPFIVVSALDLRAFVGGTGPVAPAIPVAFVAAAAIGFAVVVIAAGFVAIAAARRISPAAVVKMGAE